MWSICIVENSGSISSLVSVLSFSQVSALQIYISICKDFARKVSSSRESIRQTACVWPRLCFYRPLASVSTDVKALLTRLGYFGDVFS
ncbi:hypothetical protein PVAP13_3KG060127 [Panicum virgatum]|uniref:Uncharacterized protein n=1 Tax=Panicum virgatum TaxID=38727 RepID=A0A8T0UM81_PANVG|nr:hypothetical protein PVAP13_3KG060127 [Panicum virgatum]